ncbi:MAG: hypothetical protein M9953_09060 [Thermomicrobiales bacterium]|nr:hypothetical protein [Thermomicrobiales bacterium]MCO5225473.1 hypothetical protein [Thermomicrobiales bacterium]MCO5227905.1 hypothetical protein [Thermomicrobiales bacterium]
MIEPTEPHVENEEPVALISPQDIRSTSRSCLVVILAIVFILLLLCVFVVVQTWFR